MKAHSDNQDLGTNPGPANSISPDFIGMRELPRVLLHTCKSYCAKKALIAVLVLLMVNAAVAENNSLDLELIETPETASSGEDFQIKYEVTNQANETKSFSLDMSYIGKAKSYSGATRELKSGEEQSYSVYFHVPKYDENTKQNFGVNQVDLIYDLDQQEQINLKIHDNERYRTVYDQENFSFKVPDAWKLSEKIEANIQPSKITPGQKYFLSVRDIENNRYIGNGRVITYVEGEKISNKTVNLTLTRKALFPSKKEVENFSYGTWKKEIIVKDEGRVSEAEIEFEVTNRKNAGVVTRTNLILREIGNKLSQLIS